jgi:5-hydroxyisourate hydrolase
MKGITTHVLDTSCGRPAKGITAVLELKKGDDWQKLGQGVTNADGRIADLLPADHDLQSGIYRLTFETKSYFAENKVDAFYPSVPIHFEIADANQHYHVPLLLNPFGYSTYRGS